jgi:ribosome-associated protein
MTGDGVVDITAQRFRTQERNRQDALDRLIELIRAAATPPRRRIATRPPAASRRRRAEVKERRSRAKSFRTRPQGESD